MLSADKPQSDYERRREEDKKNALAILVLFVLLLGGFVFLVSGCASPVVPDPVYAREASFDGNDQTSGVLVSTPSGFVVTENFRRRYNALIATYGGDFNPILKPDQNIAPIGDDRWLISKQGMIDFLEMNTWRKAGLKPRNP
jgi:hypothetical protein